jgi:hypothetical protein
VEAHWRSARDTLLRKQAIKQIAGAEAMKLGATNTTYKIAPHALRQLLAP